MLSVYSSRGRGSCGMPYLVAHSVSGGSFRIWWLIPYLVVHSGTGGSFRDWWLIPGLVAHVGTGGSFHIWWLIPYLVAHAVSGLVRSKGLNHYTVVAPWVRQCLAGSVLPPQCFICYFSVANRFFGKFTIFLLNLLLSCLAVKKIFFSSKNHPTLLSMSLEWALKNIY